MSLESAKIDLSELPLYIHQAVLNPHLSLEKLNEICDACIHLKLSGLCTHPLRLSSARIRLGSRSATQLISVIAFPFGCIPFHLKKSEAEWAASEGADELELVPNFLDLNERNGDKFAEEISEICEIGLPVKAILDINNLSKEKLSFAVNASIEAGVKSIQVGTGFGLPINSEKIKLLQQETKGRCSLKAVGGIRSLAQVLELIDSGVSQIGTSHSLSIMEEAKKSIRNE